MTEKYFPIYYLKIMAKVICPETFTGWSIKKFTNQYYSLDSGPLRNGEYNFKLFRFIHYYSYFYNKNQYIVGNVIPSTYQQDFLLKRNGRWYSSMPMIMDACHQEHKWEDDVIWDLDALDKTPTPSLSYALPENAFQDKTATDIENHLAAKDISKNILINIVDVQFIFKYICNSRKFKKARTKSG